MDIAHALPLDARWHVVQAHQMGGGRGRLGNQWVAESGNLYLSLILGPDIDATMRSGLSYASALAVRNTAIACGVAADRLALKWPNDVLMDGQKLSGILLEVERDRLVIGIGVNVQNPPEGRASLRTGQSVDGVRDRLLLHMHDQYHRLLDQGIAPILKEWTEHAWRLGETITVRTKSLNFEGVFIGLDVQGGLQVQDKGGMVQIIHSGEVF